MLSLISRGLRAIVEQDHARHIDSLCWEEYDDRHEVIFGLNSTELAVRNTLHRVFLGFGAFATIREDEKIYLASVDYQDDKIVFVWKKKEAA